MNKFIFLIFLCFCVLGGYAQIEQPTLVIPSGHTKIVTAATFSPDGKYVITGGADEEIRSWEAATGKQLKTYHGPAAIITALKFAPDGNRFAAGYTNGHIAVFDYPEGKIIKDLSIHSDTVTQIDFFENDRFLSGSKDRTAKIYDLTQDRATTTIHESRYKILSVAYYKSGGFIITGGGGVNFIKDQVGDDPPTKMWNVRGSKLIDFQFGAFNVGSEITTVGFSADGQYACAVGDGQGRIYDLSNKNKVKFKFNLLADFGLITPDGKAIVVGTKNQIQVVDFATGKVLRKFTPLTNEMTSLGISPDGNYLVAGTIGRMGVVIDALSGEVLRNLNSRSGGVLAVTFSPYGKYLATGSLDGTAKLWDVESGQLVMVFKDQKYPVSSLAFAPDNKTIAVGNNGNTGIVYDIGTGKPVYAFNGGSGSIVYSRDGKKMLALNKTENVLSGWLNFANVSAAFLYDAESGKPLFQLSHNSVLSSGKRRMNTSAVFSPDGKFVYIGGKQEYPLKNNDKVIEPFGEIQVYDTQTGKWVRDFAETDDDIIMSMDINKEGTEIVTVSNKNSITFWNPMLGRRTNYYTALHKGPIASVSYSPDQKTLLTAGYDKHVAVLDLEKINAQIMDGHSAELISAKFSPTGKYFVTGSLDNTTRLWDLNTRKEIAKLIPVDVSEWIVLTPGGLFDGSEQALKTLYYGYGLQTIPLTQLKARYYVKGLLPILLGYSGNKLPVTVPFTKYELYPSVKLSQSINGNNPIVTISATNNGGGIGKIVVGINGTVAFDDAKLNGKSKPVVSGDALKLSLDLSASKLINWGARNKISVTAFNRANTLASEAVEIEFDAPKRIK